MDHESALRSAFQNLLDETGRRFGWTLIPELSDTAEAAEGKTVRPDGTFRDDYYITRGHWEAKDTHDHLETEIKRKIAKGYPLGNIIFEDTRQAYLYQNGQLAMKADLTQPQAAGRPAQRLLRLHRAGPRGFRQGHRRVPGAGARPGPRAGREDPATPTSSNRRFIEAFEAFYDLCRNSLNPNLSVAAVDEMLVQHLLTERLIRTIFDNQDFTRRNVIAAEVEKVIDALVSKSFNRHDFLKSLDRFYLAIESAAATIESFTEKQHFLNTVYERFFQGYSVKVADTHGIVYTPQEIVDFMCASVAEVLESEFGKTLGDEDVHILDPCTGTGNFIVNLMRRIPKKDLPRMYREQLFANEVMLLPYYIAALNIEHAYYEQTGEYEPFEGLCFVDTLDLAKGSRGTFGFMTQENVGARGAARRRTPITVIIGNPPYNAWQLNENDNNKNRKYDVIDRRVSETYAKDSKASNKNALSDMYVKFFRWATDRLNGRDGIVCFVSNNSFVDQIAFDGMRKHLLEDFTALYHVASGRQRAAEPATVGHDLQRVRHPGRRRDYGRGPVAADTAGIGVFHRVDKTLRRQQKLAWLRRHGDINGVKWERLKPDERKLACAGERASSRPFVPIGSEEVKAALDEWASRFRAYSSGVKTNRDDVVYDFQPRSLANESSEFIEDVQRRGRPVQACGEERRTSMSSSATNEDQMERVAEANVRRERTRSSTKRGSALALPPFTEAARVLRRS